MYSSARAMSLSYGYFSCGDLEMSYQMLGSGEPLLLLLEGIANRQSAIHPILIQMSQHRRVIAIEHPRNGREAGFDRPDTVEQMADDVATLLGHLQIDAIDAFGYGQGSKVVQELARRHPKRVRLVAFSISSSPGSSHQEAMFAGSARMPPGEHHQARRPVPVSIDYHLQ